MKRGGPHSYPPPAACLQAQVPKESELFNPGAISPESCASERGSGHRDSHGISNSGLNHCQQAGSAENEAGGSEEGRYLWTLITSITHPQEHPLRCGEMDFFLWGYKIYISFLKRFLIHFVPNRRKVSCDRKIIDQL